MTAAGSNGVGVGVKGGARRKRRFWSVAERQRIVEAALTPGASVARVARANGVNANLVFKWIGRSREGWPDRRCGAGNRAPAATSSSREASETPRFVPIRLVAPQRGSPALTPAEMEGAPGLRQDPPSAARLGAMEVRLPNGAQVRIEEGVDGEVLRLVLSTLSGL
jgi:transposase